MHLYTYKHETPVEFGMLFEELLVNLNKEQFVALRNYYDIQRTEEHYSRLIPAQNVAPSNDITKYRTDKYNHKRCNHIIQARLSVFDRDDAERVQTFYYMYNEFN